jgi:hypothetical protein
LVPCTPSLLKFVDSPKLTFLSIIGDVFFISSHRSSHWNMSFKTYQTWTKVNVWCFGCFVLYKLRTFCNISLVVIPYSQRASTIV